MSVRASLRQALRISQSQKPPSSLGNSGLFNGKGLNSTGHACVISRSFNKAAAGDTDGRYVYKARGKTTGKATGKATDKSKGRPPFEHADHVSRFTKGLLPDGQDPVKTFKAHLKDGTLPKSLATSCLKTAIRQERFDDGLGEAAITWFWNEHDSYKFPDDTDMLDCMVRFLYREGKEDRIWEWIEKKSRKRENVGPNDRFAWRADTVRSLITAKAFASEDSLDSALETFFRAKSSTYSIPVAPAMVQVAKLLMMPATRLSDQPSDVEFKTERPRWPNTSLELWEKFLKNIDAKRDVSEPFRVQLPLYRPDKPDPFPFLKYSRHLASHPSLVQKMLKRQSLVPWLARSRHAEALLRQEGHHEDAKFLEEFTQELDTKSEEVREKYNMRREGRRKKAEFGDLNDLPFKH
ncbi:hypothetical protein D6D10_09474 [Aureobasidium pullulans]|uniref:Uncharacterized protein n=1 Tax=Aureobasidium pullulans TaxID=5580 RepID=A0A4S9E0V8_AURPU|nr:hypothetical protein D6D10_09474 [Aureobasidium pullulans]